MDIPVSKTVFSVPPSHRHCELLNFRWPSLGVQTAVELFMGNLLGGKRTNLLFTGMTGTGKTHLAVALYRWGVLHWGTMDCTLILVPEFFHKVKQGFNQPEQEDSFRDLEEARKLVVFDDILGRTPTPWELDHIVFRLINTAYTNRASTVVTTNFTRGELGQVLKPHEMSRLLDGVVHIEFQGKDHRLP